MDLLSAIQADTSDAAPKKAAGPVGDLLGGITDSVPARKWLPHLNGSGKVNEKTGQPYEDAPTGLQGRVMDRGQTDNYDGDGKVEYVVIEHTDGSNWRVVGDHFVLNDEIKKRNPQIDDLWAVKHLGARPNAKNPRRKPTQVYGSVQPIRGHFAN